MLHVPPRKFLLMRRPLAFLLLGFLTTTSEADIQPGVQSTKANLPKEIVPRNYLIYLEPDTEARVMDGVESIEIEVLEPTNRANGLLNSSFLLKTGMLDASCRSL